jgi:iron complex transport system ATP-binding protein
MTNTVLREREPLSSFAIILKNVCVDYPGQAAIVEISWKLAHGTHGAILGPNGSGKSTLLRAITGYGHITSGEIVVLGETLGQTEIHALHRRIGVVDPRLSRWLDGRTTALQLVTTGFFGNLTPFFDVPTPQQLELARSLLDEVGLGNRADQEFASMSSGQQSRAWLARSLVHQPELLVLDEPTADLDLVGRATFLATLDVLTRRRQMATLMITHHIEDLLPAVGNIMLLADGRSVIHGGPDEVLTGYHLSRAFGCPVEVGYRHGRRYWSIEPAVWQQLSGRAERTDGGRAGV